MLLSTAGFPLLLILPTSILVPLPMTKHGCNTTHILCPPHVVLILLFTKLPPLPIPAVQVCLKQYVVSLSSSQKPLFQNCYFPLACPHYPHSQLFLLFPSRSPMSHVSDSSDSQDENQNCRLYSIKIMPSNTINLPS